MAKETKKTIFINLCNLMNDYSLDEITVTLLVQKCNISRQTFYYHFSDIESLLRWGIEQSTATCVQKANQATNMKEATFIFLSMVDEGFETISKMINSSYNGYVTKLIKQSILEYMTNYTVRVQGEQSLNSANAKFLLSFISNGITGEILTSMYTKRRLDVEATSNALSELFFEKFINE
jgi:AcrR family transcriptional regulator